MEKVDDQQDEIDEIDETDGLEKCNLDHFVGQHVPELSDCVLCSS